MITSLRGEHPPPKGRKGKEGREGIGWKGWDEKGREGMGRKEANFNTILDSSIKNKINKNKN